MSPRYPLLIALFAFVSLVDLYASAGTSGAAREVLGVLAVGFAGAASWVAVNPLDWRK